MDRALNVYEPNQTLLAELTFHYHTENSGMVKIGIYTSGPDNLPDGLSPMPVPLVLYTADFNHSPLTSIDAVAKYDQEFVTQELKKRLQKEKTSLRFEYLPEFAERRVIAKDNTLYGLATIRTCFSENRKTVEFISADRIGADYAFTTTALKYTTGILNRLLNSQPA